MEAGMMSPLERNDQQGIGKTWYFRSSDEGLRRVLGDGVVTRIFWGVNVMLSFVDVAANTTTTVHCHPEEQWGHLLEGECVRIQDGQEIEMKAGDFWFTPGNVKHGIRTGSTPARILDIFSPPRKPYAESEA
jgi:quercetin dioxygenase-like cupin family protein